MTRLSLASARELWGQARGRRRAPLVNTRQMLMCAAASSENCAVSHHQHSVLMGPVLHRRHAEAKWLRAYHPSHSHPSSLVSCLTVGRDPSRDISASATLSQPLSLALMSPDGSDRERSPLEPVKDNILLVAGEPPPLDSTSSRVGLTFQPVRSPCLALWESAVTCERRTRFDGGARCVVACRRLVCDVF